MPTTKKLCSQAGCNRTQKESYCDKHKRVKSSFTAKGSKEELFYHTTRWRKLRKYFITKNPLCVICLSEGRTTPAKVVDHVIPLRLNYELRLDSNNLQALCSKCHNNKSARGE